MNYDPLVETILDPLVETILAAAALNTEYALKKSEETRHATERAEALRRAVENKKGSENPSPLLAEWQQVIRHGLPPNDVQKRFKLYQQLREQFAQDITLVACCEKLTSGAVGDKGFTFALKKNSAQPLDTKSENSTKDQQDTTSDNIRSDADKLKEDVLDPLRRKFLTPHVLRRWAYDIGMYANLPIEIVRTGNQITDITGFAPYAFAKNADARNRLSKGGDAYIQFDAASWIPIPRASWSQREMIWATWKRPTGELYGVPPFFAVGVHSVALIETLNDLYHARKGALPEKFVMIGSSGEPADASQMRDFYEQTNAGRLNRGLDSNKYPLHILNNGGSSPVILAPTTNYFNDLADIELLQRRIAAAFKVPLELVFPTTDLDERLLAALTESLYVAQGEFASDVLEQEIILPIFRIAAEAAGYDLSEYAIDFYWAERQLESRMLQRAMSASTWAQGQAPGITEETRTRIQCAYLGIDADAELDRLKTQRKEHMQRMQDAQQNLIQSGNTPPPSDPSLQGDVVTRNPHLALINGQQKQSGRDKAKLAPPDSKEILTHANS